MHTFKSLSPHIITLDIFSMYCEVDLKYEKRCLKKTKMCEPHYFPLAG